MGEFTYKLPDEGAFFKALLIKLKAEGLIDIKEILSDSRCELAGTQSFAYPRGGRYNAFIAQIIFYIPLYRYELAEEKITDEIKSKIVEIADSLISPKAGYDILSVKLTPSLETTSEQSLSSDLQRVTETLPVELTRIILPDDIKEKGKEMIDAYFYLYCVENALRLFVEKVAKSKYGDSYFSCLNANTDIQKKIKQRQRDEEKNLWLSVRRGNSEIFYLDFDDIGFIISNNWEIFKTYFPKLDWIVPKIDELSKCRNLVAHNSYIGNNERDTIRVYFNNILNQIRSTFDNTI